MTRSTERKDRQIAQSRLCRCCETRFNKSLPNCVLMAYYRVTDYPGDIYHKSEACAGGKATAIDENEARESASRPCKQCGYRWREYN